MTRRTSPDRAGVPASVRWYSRLTRLYPRGIRDSYGTDMAQVYAQRLRDRQAQGWWPGVFIARELLGLIGDAIVQRLPVPFGQGRERGRGSRRARWGQGGLRQDLAYTTRQLRRHPGFAIVVIVTLGLGIGANTAIFSVVDALLLRPLAVSEPGELVAVRGAQLNGGRPDAVFGGFLPISQPDFIDLRDRNSTLSGLYLHHATQFSLAAEGEPERLMGEFVSGSYFDVLGIRPVLGRFFLEEEDAAAPGDPVVVLSHSLWSRKFGKAAGVIGSGVSINGQPFTVIGVGPKGFAGTDRTNAVSFWVPVSWFPRLAPSPLDALLNVRGARMFYAVGRRQPGVAPEQARADLTRIAEQLRRDHAENRNRTVSLMPLQQATVDPAERGGYLRAGAVMLAVVGLVLLIACANIANLLLARAITRRRETAVRLALGAARARLARQFLTESLVLGVLGGGLGLLLAIFGGQALWTFRPPTLAADALVIGVDARILAFAIVVSVISGLLFGLAPVFHLRRSRWAEQLTQRGRDPGGGARSWVGRPMIAAQVAVCLAALVVTGLFLRGLREARGIDPGFDPHNLIAVSFQPAAQGWDEPRVREYYRRTIEAVGSLPDVARVSLAQVRPFTTTFQRGTYREDQGPDEDPALWIQANIVQADYLETMGIPLLGGRALDGRDRADTEPIVILNRTAAESLWPGEDAVGKRIRFGSYENGVFALVVGVAQDAKYLGIDEDPMPYAYLPLEQWYPPGATLVARTTGDASRTLQPLLATLRSLEPTLPLVHPRTGEDLLHDARWAPRMGAILMTVFGGLALVLVLVGLYGVTAFSVGQRRRELAVRIAVGASQRQVAQKVVRETLAVVLIGLALGTLGTLAANRFVATLLVGVEGADPVTFGAVLALMISVSALASYLPARRASSLDPVIPLRGE